MQSKMQLQSGYYKIPWVFSEYIQSIIEENSDVKKEIIIPKERNIKRISEFYLNEEKNEFILVKKK